MTIRLYDTLQRKKVPFEPAEPGKVGIYVCGPTVYDRCHIGHARVYVAFDVVKRHFEHRGFQVNYVRNITDVDDKIIKRALESGEDPLALSNRMAEEFRSDMRALGNGDPSVEPKVSEHIPEIIAMIERLIAQDHAYAVGADVFFAVESFPRYGELSARKLDEQQQGARVEVDQRKRHPYDFALWKEAKPDEPAWDSPWGPGRPGWHIECSAMSCRYLGAGFDIHGGGMDLIFPHHENEIAQSKACNGDHTFSRFWMHNGFVNVSTPSGDMEKMSKSLGNFFTVRDVLGLHEAEALRLFLLSTQYRKPLGFEVEQRDSGAGYPGLEEAEQRLSYAYTTRQRLQAALTVGKDPGPGEMLPEVEQFESRLLDALDDDFNSAAAIGHVSELLTTANRLLDQPKSAPKPVRRRSLQAIESAFATIGQVLGLFAEDPETFLTRRRERLCRRIGLDPQLVEQKLRARQQARADKDFAAADRLRAELTELGVEVMDGAGTSTWRVME